MSTCVPLPPERLMEMPGSRCNDSETFWSGILPMSSATIDSMGWMDLRLESNALCTDARYPVTTTSCRSPEELLCEAV